MKTYSFFIRLFISLTLLLVIPVIIVNAISYYFILQNSQSEISKSNIGKLKVATNIIKQLESNVNKDSVRLSVNNIINNLNDLNNRLVLNNGDDLIKFSKVLNTLSEMVGTNSEYHSIYLYLEDFNYTFTSNKGLVKNDAVTDTEWMKYYEVYKNERTTLSLINTRIPFDKAENTDGNSSYGYVSTYIYPLTPYTTNLKGAIAINIQEDAINKLINSSNSNIDGYMFIMSSSGDMLVNGDKNLLCKNISNHDYVKKILANSSTEGYLVSSINKTKSIVSFYKSDFNDWIFVGISPINTLTKSTNNILIKAIYASLFIILFGILISFLVSRRIYSPVEKLIKHIKSTKGIELKGNEDEMSILNKAFNIILKQNKNLIDGSGNNKKDQLEKYISNLISGQTVNDVDKTITEEFFTSNCFICAIIVIDQYKNFTKAYEQVQQLYMKTMISQVIVDILKTTFKCISFNISKGEIVFVATLNDIDSYNAPQILYDNFIKIKDELSKVLDYSISTGIGHPHTGTPGIKDSYIEAQNALKQKLKLGYGSIIIWDEEFSDNNYYYPLSTEKHIINYLDVRSKEDILVTVNELTEALIKNTDLYSENIIQIFTQLVGNTIIKYLLQQHVSVYDIFGAKFNIYYQLSTKENIFEVKDWLMELYLKIIDYLNTSKCNSKKSLDLIQDYISKNYRSDIGISNISEFVGLSYSHVRKLFKDEIGENIIDYINNMRIKEAKYLLLNTDKSVKNIALAVGYNNDQSFTRFFKKFEGITPGELRNKQS